MAHDKNQPQESSGPGPAERELDPALEKETQPEPGPEQEFEPQPEQPESEPGEIPAGQWEDPPRPPSPSGFNPDYWPKY